MFLMLTIAVKVLAGLVITICGLGLIAMAVEDYHSSTYIIDHTPPEGKAAE